MRRKSKLGLTDEEILALMADLQAARGRYLKLHLLAPGNPFPEIASLAHDRDMTEEVGQDIAKLRSEELAALLALVEKLLRLKKAPKRILAECREAFSRAEQLLNEPSTPRDKYAECVRQLHALVEAVTGKMVALLQG